MKSPPASTLLAGAALATAGAVIVYRVLNKVTKSFRREPVPEVVRDGEEKVVSVAPETEARETQTSPKDGATVTTSVGSDWPNTPLEVSPMALKDPTALRIYAETTPADHTNVLTTTDSSGETHDQDRIHSEVNYLNDLEEDEKDSCRTFAMNDMSTHDSASNGRVNEACVRTNYQLRDVKTITNGSYPPETTTEDNPDPVPSEQNCRRTLNDSEPPVCPAQIRRDGMQRHQTVDEKRNCTFDSPDDTAVIIPATMQKRRKPHRRKRRRRTEPIKIQTVQCLSFRNVSHDLFLHSRSPLYETSEYGHALVESDGPVNPSGPIHTHHHSSRELNVCPVTTSNELSISTVTVVRSLSAEALDWFNDRDDPVQLVHVSENPIELFAYRCYTVELRSASEITEKTVRTALAEMQDSHPLLRMHKTQANDRCGLTETENPTVDFAYICEDLRNQCSNGEESEIADNNIWKVRALVLRNNDESNPFPQRLVFYFLFYGNFIKPKNCKRLSEEFVDRLNLQFEDQCNKQQRRHLLLPLGMLANESDV